MAADRADALVIFGATRLYADSWRWADVPILIRAGKCMPMTATEISVKFRRPPHDVFGLERTEIGNWLRFRIWPQARVSLGFVGKKPGAGWSPQQEDLVFTEQAGEDMRPYDRLIGVSWGPKEADTLVPDGEPWHDPVAS